MTEKTKTSAQMVALRYRKKGLKYCEIHERLVSDHNINVSLSSISNYFRKPKQEQAHKSKKPKVGRPDVLAPLTKEVIYAAAVMTRYSSKRLVSLIEPFYGLLQGNADKNIKLCERTVTRFLRDVGIEKNYQTPNEWPNGTLVLHSVQIHWQQTGKSNLNRETLLCLCERHTGFAYFVAYSRIKHDSLYHRIQLFKDKYQAEINQVVLTTERLKTKAEDSRIASVISKTYKPLLKELRRDRINPDLKIQVSPATPRRMEVIAIPSEFDNRDQLNRFLAKVADRYNMEDREMIMGKDQQNTSKWSPRKRLWSVVKELHYYERETFIKKSRFSSK